MLYLDTSAAVKLVNRELESDALAAYLRGLPAEQLVSAALVRTELPRAVGGPSVQVERLLGSLRLLELTGSLLDEAGQLLPGSVLRSLDAIHLAAARRLRDGLVAVLTYDRRLAEAAVSLGMPVAAPS